MDKILTELYKLIEEHDYVTEDDWDRGWCAGIQAAINLIESH